MDGVFFASASGRQWTAWWAMPLNRLSVADHPAALWANVVEPWLRAHGAAWRERPAILTPNTAWAAALKAQAVAANLPALGVAWFTPGRWRAQALRAGNLPLKVALREDLHLLVELAAAQLPGNPLARAYGPDPAPFQALLDTLDGAGWSGTELADPAARELAAAVIALRKQAGWVTAAEADRALREAAIPLMGERLLAVGFGPGDWALRPLLEAAARAYAQVEFAFDVVDYEETAAATWVGTWEETGVNAEWIELPEAPAPFAPLALAFLEKKRSPRTRSIETEPGETIRPQIWLADDLQAEADIVVAQALAFLSATKTPARVGLVVGPINSPLAREVAARLAGLNLPYHDALGYQPGQGPAQTLFEAWLDWQENGRLVHLTTWARIARQHGLISVHDADAAERAWQDAAATTWSDEPEVLAAWLPHAGTNGAVALQFMGEWPRLPATASWDEWIRIISSVAERLHWPDPPESLDECAEAWTAFRGTALPRAAALRWVRAVTRLPGRTRDERGREPFAPLQIVAAASAAALPWTHLVLGGLQHGEWPADDEDSPLLDEACLAFLNNQVLQQGSQGEGHRSIAPGHGWLPPAAERHRLARAAFARLLSLPTEGLALTSRRTDPASGRPARQSEYFWTAAAQALGRLPTDADWEQRAGQTRQAQIQVQAVISPAEDFSADGTELAAPARAYAARRAPTKVFDEFSFCLSRPSSAPLVLSCRAWEYALTKPGAAWFKYLLGVEPRWDPATDDPRSRSVGLWAHAWVRPGPETGPTAPSLPLPERALWQKLARARADDARTQIIATYAAAGKILPEAWMDAWTTAHRVAQEWIDALAGTDGWSQALAEATLPLGLKGALPQTDTEFALRGRLDLVLCNRPAQVVPENLRGARAWLIDFKSGGDRPLGLTRLARGEGLQLALYALALRALGAEGVAMTTLTREAAAETQLTGADLDADALTGMWRTLAEFSSAGCWGEFHDLTDAHDRPGDYPLATLPVAGEILREKWALTHPHWKR